MARTTSKVSEQFHLKSRVLWFPFETIRRQATFFTRYANLPPFHDCAGGGKGKSSSIFFWNSHYLDVPTHEFAINAPFSRILQSERLRFLESIAKLDVGVYLRARPFSSLILPLPLPTSRRAGQKSFSVQSSLSCLRGIIQSTFFSHDDRISFSSSSHV